MSYTNVQNLNTYLSTAGTGAPSTTALAVLQGLTPIFFNFTGDTTPHYGIGTPTAINTLSGTQAKYSAVLYPSTGTPNGVTLGDPLGLIIQAIKDSNSKVPITFTAVTNSSGTVTVDLTSYALANPPIVQLTPLNTTVANPVVTNITSVTATSLVIHASQSQNILLGIVNPFTNVAATIHVAIFPQ